MALSNDELLRYQRQLTIEGWDQDKVKQSRVIVVGLGGIGGTAAMYLAAAGVGTLRLVEHDRVDVTNLNRQIPYDTSDVGRLKLECAAGRLAALNPHVAIEPVQDVVTMENVRLLAAGCDVIVDGLDNQPGREILNGAALALSIPYVYGSVCGWRGSVSVFHPPRTPCMACLTAGAPGNTPPVPALGAVAGLVGTLQAVAALTFLNSGEIPLAGRLLLLDALTMQFDSVLFQRSPSCPVCGSG
ncbi:MAG: HesA/MoeB/ThiF family protein [Acidobacteriota bacterium]